jgi:flagellar assembly protein FliH
MGAPTKFLFDLDFAEAAAGKPAERPVPRAEHALRIAEAEAAGHFRGYAEAQHDAAVEANRRIAAAMEQIAIGLATANRELHAIETRLECEAVEVAVAVARKLAPALVAREPFTEIAALAADCFRQLTASPHVVVRINDALYATAKEKLEAIARANNYEGRLVVLAEPDVPAGDCRIEWADGGVNRDSAVTGGAIGDAVDGYLRARRNLAEAPEVTRSSAHE